jgi:dehydrogenase/reductase SDR family protein 4
VILSSRKQKNVDDAVSKLQSEGLKACGLVCHVSKAEDRKKLFEEAQKLGGLDILVSNAAVNPSMAPVLDVLKLTFNSPELTLLFQCEEAAWDKIFEVNVKASFLLAKEALPLLRQKKCGRIIFTSSIGGFQPCEPFEVRSAAIFVS